MTADLPDQDVFDEAAEISEDLVPANIRPYRFTREKREEYLGLIRDGGRRTKTAMDVGVSPRTVTAAMRDKTGQLTTFGKAVLEAESVADDEVERALYDAAVSGNVSAAQTWLYNRRSEKWSPKTAASAVAVSGSVSSVTEVTIEKSAKEALFGVIRQMSANLTAPVFTPTARPMGEDDEEDAE